MIEKLLRRDPPPLVPSNQPDPREVEDSIRDIVARAREQESLGEGDPNAPMTDLERQAHQTAEQWRREGQLRVEAAIAFKAKCDQAANLVMRTVRSLESEREALSLRLHHLSSGVDRLVHEHLSAAQPEQEIVEAAQPAATETKDIAEPGSGGKL